MSAASITSVAKAAVVLVVAMAMTLGVTSSARADANVSVSFGGHIRGLATFFSAGDEFRICDRRKDNLPVGLRYSYIRKNGTTQRGGVWHQWGVDGVGAPDSHGYQEKGCSYDDHNFGEGRRCGSRPVSVSPRRGTSPAADPGDQHRAEVTESGPRPAGQRAKRLASAAPTTPASGPRPAVTIGRSRAAGSRIRGRATSIARSR